MRAPALVLFDVDGTLLLTGGATTRCIWRAAEATFGRTLDRCQLTAGQLDQQLFMSLAAQCGIPNARAHLERYKTRYLVELEAELTRTRDQLRGLPGVVELLEALARMHAKVVTGLLTGNFRAATMLKLRAAGLERFSFPISAFAEDGEQRTDLVVSALRWFSGKFEGAAPANVILVGDTPRDIETARQTGCRVLAVATGVYSLAQLQAERPDAAVADLSDPTPLYDLLELAQNSRHI
jgi:phosphoglycolate phosphatase-like HAD superfamily hydrolase